MTVPTDFQSSAYPTSLDNDQNLFLVHDGLRVTLTEDYNPNDSVVANQTKIYITGDNSLFPSTGIITLTDQCNDIENRAISFFYTSKTSTTFEGLIPIPGFESANTIIRPKSITHVTQNVMAEHHNSIKDALIAIEQFVGIKGTTDVKPFGSTMEGRINFLRKLVLSPRAWFTATNTTGLVPLTTTFTNLSFRLATDNTTSDISVVWNFGDQTSNTDVSTLSTISATDVVPISSTDVLVEEYGSRIIEKTYSTPGKYSVTLTVTNEFGSDTIVFEDFIVARTEAPQEAVIDFSYTSDQIFTAGSPSGGPYTTPPKIRSKTNKFIDIVIQTGVNGSTGRSYAGEELDSWNQPIDPIETFTWVLSDDLPHENSRNTRASYSIGGLYDLVLRCDTSFGAYRITEYAEAIDIIEDRNMWLFTLSGSVATPNEFGLISETFKTGSTSYTVNRDSSFLNNTNNSTQAIQEFNRNVAFAINTNVSSGNHGTAVIAYAGGGAEGSLLSNQKVKMVDFEGFTGLITDNSVDITRPWNWIYFPFGEKTYFILGPDPAATADENSSDQIKDTLDVAGTLTLETPTSFIDPDNYLNGADELINHVTSGYDSYGEPNSGRFAVYRSAVKDTTGYFLRNDGVGSFFKFRQFYRTEGTTVEPLINIRKLQDMSGTAKTEGQLVSLTNGLFFFNNSGNIVAFNTVDNTWEVGNSVAPFKSFQDTTIENHSDLSQTLMATSDGERVAYLSFDYSYNAFVKYNSVDKTFYSIGSRPTGDQWVLGIY